MANQKSISFRTALVGETTDLLGKVDLHCARTAKLIAALISRLAAYTEEGVPLSPSVFLCNSIVDLVKRAGAGEHVVLMEGQDTETAASTILKVAAPLCGGSWKIYVQREGDGSKCSFGVFSTANDPTSLSVEEVLLDEYEPGFPIVRIAQRGTNKVEVITNAGEGIEFRFNDDVDVVDVEDTAAVKGLALSIAMHVPERREEFAEFVARVLIKAISASHGCLIAVLAEGMVAVPGSLSDTVLLHPAIDLYHKYRRHIEEGKTAGSMGQLQMAADLLEGFVRSDGITVFTSTGAIVAYRGFIKSDQPNAPSTGGARTRAYQALKLKLGTDLQAAFFRSQDGKTDLSEPPNA